MPIERCAICDRAGSLRTGERAAVERDHTRPNRQAHAAAHGTTEPPTPIGYSRAAYRKFMLRHGPQRYAPNAKLRTSASFRCIIAIGTGRTTALITSSGFV